MTDYDLTLMSEECQGMGYMPLKHLPLGWCGRNMKAISYILQQYTFQNLNTGINV